MKTKQLNAMVLSALLILPTINVHAEEAHTLNIPVTSMFYSQNSRFSSHQSQVFSTAIYKIMQQLKCTANIEMENRSDQRGFSGLPREVDSNKSEMRLMSTCPEPLEIGFQTLTSELVKVAQLKPDLLFLNGRLVRLQGDVGTMRFSDNEVITSKNIGTLSSGYSSHPSKSPELDHIDNIDAMRSMMLNAGLKVGAAGIVIGGTLFSFAAGYSIHNAGFAVFKYLNLLQSPLAKAWEAVYYDEFYVSAVGAAAASVGLFVALISFPTGVEAGNLDARYRQPEFQAEMVTSKGFQNLVAHFGPKSTDILSTYESGKSLREAVARYSKSDADRVALAAFYKWWL